ncbi:LPS-assembly protein LptD [Chitinimonas lacunae]|uniref:LPS-assembly protein LptD n=1 Tax=Chitinimonas lacunae TaxID=1963018 RepID=A0ABV8MSU0_9NEIS
MPRFRPLPLFLALSAAFASAHAAEEGPTHVEADEMFGKSDDYVEASGRAVVTRTGEKLEADWIKLFKKTDELRAGDKTRLTRDKDVLEGGALHLFRTRREGSLESPVYQLGSRQGRGDAVRLLFQGPERYALQQARFTTCQPGQDDWFITARELQLDYNRNVGVARHSTIEFKGVPFLYLPYLDFSLDGARKSGFLAPSYNSTNSRGFEIALPYYWNIAPNMDATFSPRLMSKRGVLLDNEFRYLNTTYAGQLDFGLIGRDRKANAPRLAFDPQDPQRDERLRINDRRFAYRWVHSQQLMPQLFFNADLQKASDNYYFSDFGDRLAVASTRHLPRLGSLTYLGPWYNVQLRGEQYQTLQEPDPNRRIDEPYARLPQLSFNATPPMLGPVQAQLNSELTRFDHTSKVQGERLLAYPSLSLPLTAPYGFFIPKVGIHHTQYRIDANQQGWDRRTTRTMPITSLDTGLFFDRDFSWKDTALVQSLEPRLYYVHIPYRDQRRIPLFDSAQTDFNTAQMFSENQFTGSDRINDANQLTVALTSRIFEADSGIERLRVAVGRRYYFDPRRVWLNNDPNASEKDVDFKASDIIATVGGQPLHDWWLDAGWQYDRNTSRSQKVGFNIRYQPGDNKLFNVRYQLNRLIPDTNVRVNRPDRNYLEQIDLSGQWPLGGNWYGVARYNHSITAGRTLETLGGLEYNGGCWVFRLVGQRFVTSSNTYQRKWFLQLELNDIGRLGSNPLQVLKERIPGYTKLN